MHEAAGQALSFGKPPGLGDQCRVEVNTDKLGVRTQCRGGGHRTHDETQPAPDVDDTNPVAAPAYRLDERAKEVRDPAAELKLLTQPLQLAVHAHAKGVDVVRIQYPPRRRER